jgi:hypothetical protein
MVCTLTLPFPWKGEEIVSNPRLRKIRDALSQLGLPADEPLDHGTPRLVYGVQLAHNMREYLLGRAKRPTYLLPPPRRRNERAEQGACGVGRPAHSAGREACGVRRPAHSGVSGDIRECSNGQEGSVVTVSNRMHSFAAARQVSGGDL